MGIVTCPDCGNQISDRSKKCIHCGCPSTKFKAPKMISCPECGESIDTNNEKCPNCGFPIDKANLVLKDNNQASIVVIHGYKEVYAVFPVIGIYKDEEHIGDIGHNDILTVSISSDCDLIFKCNSVSETVHIRKGIDNHLYLSYKNFPGDISVTKVNEYVCANCGTPVTDNDTICPKCGRPINNDSHTSKSDLEQNSKETDYGSCLSYFALFVIVIVGLYWLTWSPICESMVSIGECEYIINSIHETATIVGYKAEKDRRIFIPGEVKFGDTKYKVNKIGKNVFNGVEGSIYIPESVEEISSGNFIPTGRLEVTLPKKLKKYENKYYGGLKYIYY